MTLELAQRLVQLRKDKGFSQEDLACHLGVSRQAVSKWERAEASPDTDNLIALARLYGVSLDELVFPPKAAGMMDVPHTSTADAPVQEEELPLTTPAEEAAQEIGPTIPASSYVEDAGPTVPAEEIAEEIETQYMPEDPLPDGSYYDAVRRREQEEQEERRRHFPYPVAVTVVYLLAGFLLGWWHPGWILFLTIPLYYARPEDRAFPQILGNPVFLTIVYMILGCCFHLWHPGWLVYLLLPVMHTRH